MISKKKEKKLPLLSTGVINNDDYDMALVVVTSFLISILNFPVIN